MKSLDEKILEFGHLLRRRGVNITHSQIADALESAVLVGTDRPGFETALSCTLIKDIEDLPVFEELFPRYFGVPSPNEEQPEEETLREQDAGETEEEDENTAPDDDDAAEDDPRYQMLLKAAKEGDYLMLHRIGKSAVDSLGTLHSRHLFRVRELMARAKKSIGWQRAWDTLCTSNPSGKDEA